MQIGYEAAALLDRMMSGSRPKGTVYVDALRVVTRSSTDIQSIADPLVAEAVASFAIGRLSRCRSTS